MGRIEKNIWSFKYPEFKVDTCVTGWTWVPCPTWKNPGRKCKKDIMGPCKKTKTSQFRIFVLIIYPDTVEEVVRREINKCADVALGVATSVIVDAATASSVVGPQATIAAAIGAIGPAAKAYGESFYTCLTNINVSQVIRDHIKVDLKYETKGITGWREYYDEPIYNEYIVEPRYSGYYDETVNNEYNIEFICPYLRY